MKTARFFHLIRRKAKKVRRTTKAHYTVEYVDRKGGPLT